MSDYVNKNTCRTYNLSVTTALVQLQPETCSEVIIINKTGNSINVFDNGFVATSAALLLDTDESIILRGITNTSAVSAKTLAGSGYIYYRTQNFSNHPL